MEAQQKSLTSKHEQALELNDSVFAVEFNQGLVHQLMEAYRAKRRAGTKAQKTRSDVSGGGRKPYAQKGTGNARAGTTRSPLWRSGGVTFAARPRDYTQKMNRKAHRAAMRSVFSQLQREQRLLFVDELKLADAKTKSLLSVLGDLKSERIYILTADVDSSLVLASRNLGNVHLSTVNDINVLGLIGCDKIIITAEAHKRVEEILA